MKVKHLIRELKKCNPELEVITEGCDCQGDSAAVKRQKTSVLIIRGASLETDEPYDNTQDTLEPLS